MSLQHHRDLKGLKYYPPFIVIMYKFKLNASYLLRGDLYGEEKLDCVWEFSTLNLLTFYLLWQLRCVCMNEKPRCQEAEGV